MFFDKILAKLLFEKKYSPNHIISIIAIMNLIVYFMLIKYIFKPMNDSKSALVLILTFFMFFFLFRIYKVRKYLKDL